MTILLLALLVSVTGDQATGRSAPINPANVGNMSVFPAGSTAGTTFATHLSGWWNVRSSGVKCDNSTNDTAALGVAAGVASASGVGLLIPCKVRIASAAGTITVPVRFEGGGSLDLQTGGSVTLSGELVAGLHQIFYANGGTPTFGAAVAQIFPEWFGAKGDGTTDDWAAFLAAVKALGSMGGGELRISARTYMLSKAVPLITGLRIRGAGYRSRLKASSTFGLIGEAYPSKLVALAGFAGISQFNQQYDTVIASYQNSDGSVSDVSIDDLVLDGNKDTVSFNTFGAAGATDDAYQNLIRLDQVKSSTFRNLWLENAVYNAISNYDFSDDNLYDGIVITNVGKSGITPGFSQNGIYLEAGNSRVRFQNITMTTVAQNGVLIKSTDGRTTDDCSFRDMKITGAALDGMRIGDDADNTGTTLRTTLSQVTIVNSATTAGAAAIRVGSASTSTGYAADTTLTNITINGGGNSGGILVGGPNSAAARRTQILGANVTGATGSAIRILSGASETLLSGAVSNGNGGDYELSSSAINTRVAGAMTTGVSTYDFLTTPRIAAGSGISPFLQWNEDTVGAWTAGISPGTNRWYLNGLSADQIYIQFDGIHLNNAVTDSDLAGTGTRMVTADSTGKLSAAVPASQEVLRWHFRAAMTAALTLGGTHLPAASQVVRVEGVVGVASGGGAGSTVVTITDGTNTCTATLACTSSSTLNAVVNFTVANGAGTGCVYAAGADLTASVTTAGCTTTQPSILPINFYVAWK